MSAELAASSTTSLPNTDNHRDITTHHQNHKHERPHHRKNNENDKGKGHGHGHGHNDGHGHGHSHTDIHNKGHSDGHGHGHHTDGHGHGQHTDGHGHSRGHNHDHTHGPDDEMVDGEMIHVPLVHDSMSFDKRQQSRLKDMERRVEQEMRRKKREWEREVERMRDEFLHLHPSDKVWGSDELLNDPLVAKRRGSTDILDTRKMKTLYLDYPDAGRRYKLRFNVDGFEPKNLRVTTDGDRVVVRGTKMEETEGGETQEREYCRKIQKPRDVDSTKFKAYLTADSILIVEAPLPPTSLNLRKILSSPVNSPHQSCHSRSPSNSPGPDTPSKEKIGVPIFREENGHRRLHLVVDLGSSFKPQEITVQIIKDNKILIRAKHEEKTTERLSKSKYYKEYELGEKIETMSLSGVLQGEGRLIVSAYAKGHGDNQGSKSTTSLPADDQAHSEGASAPVQCSDPQVKSGSGAEPDVKKSSSGPVT